jgi:hypothetical protein
VAGSNVTHQVPLGGLEVLHRALLVQRDGQARLARHGPGGGWGGQGGVSFCLGHRRCRRVPMAEWWIPLAGGADRLDDAGGLGGQRRRRGGNNPAVGSPLFTHSLCMLNQVIQYVSTVAIDSDSPDERVLVHLLQRPLPQARRRHLIRFYRHFPSAPGTLGSIGMSTVEGR